VSAGPETERDLRAAEYVLGSLSPDERAAFELERVVDPATARAVAAWERRLGPLALAVPAEMPPDHVWPRIAGALTGADAIPAPAPLASAPPAPAPTAANDDRAIRLVRQVRRWRLVAAGTGLLAAGLALFVAVGGRRDEPAPGTRYLAVVQSGGALPALVLRIDTATGTAEVRPVGAETPSGKSLELWYIGSGASPKAIGLVGASATRIALPAETAASGLIAVTVEPPGGSPNGAPTGPVVYSGTLIRE
jgi:anti-sigma-K factor RskA